MCAHSDDLRSEVHDEELVGAIRRDFRGANIDGPTRALLEYADKLTRSPSSVTKEDLGEMRNEGLCDRSIHDAVQTIAYFNYINRIADGLGVDLEPEYPPRGTS